MRRSLPAFAALTVAPFAIPGLVDAQQLPYPETREVQVAQDVPGTPAADPFRWQTVVIGTQVWMTSNLNVDTFRNGDPIPHAETAEEWKEANRNRRPAWSYLDNDPANGARYGKLYNWYAVSDPRGLAPEGWRIPSDDDWRILENHLGGREVAGRKMKSESGWGDYGNGTNESGFSGLPGYSRRWNGTFDDGPPVGTWWSSTEALVRGLADDLPSLTGGGSDPSHGRSVRCIRD